MEILNMLSAVPAKHLRYANGFASFQTGIDNLIRLVIVRKLVGTGVKKGQVWYRR
jgi:hypothetical protein